MSITRPETISQEWWDAMTEHEQEFVAEHERVHAEFWAKLKEWAKLWAELKEQGQ